MRGLKTLSRVSFPPISANNYYHFRLAITDWFWEAEQVPINGEFSLGCPALGCLTHLQCLLGPAPQVENSKSNKDSAMKCINAKGDNSRESEAQKRG